MVFFSYMNFLYWKTVEKGCINAQMKWFKINLYSSPRRKILAEIRNNTKWRSFKHFTKISWIQIYSSILVAIQDKYLKHTKNIFDYLWKSRFLTYCYFHKFAERFIQKQLIFCALFLIRFIRFTVVWHCDLKMFL